MDLNIYFFDLDGVERWVLDFLRRRFPPMTGVGTI